MANKYNSIAEINAEKESWRIMQQDTIFHGDGLNGLKGG
ncbi:hypothetical protein glysoja_014797 [Glycine soja]|nr:hypothetical protein glysoja_014797 [Glycine soja]